MLTYHFSSPFPHSKITSCCMASECIFLSSLICVLMAFIAMPGLALPVSDETYSIIGWEPLLCVSVYLQLLGRNWCSCHLAGHRPRAGYVEVFPSEDGFDLEQMELYKFHVPGITIQHCRDNYDSDGECYKLDYSCFWWWFMKYSGMIHKPTSLKLWKDTNLWLLQV